MKAASFRLLFLILSIHLFSCGGGGSSSSVDDKSPSPQNPPPQNTPVDPPLDPLFIPFDIKTLVHDLISFIVPSDWEEMSASEIDHNPFIIMAYQEPLQSSTDMFHEHVLLLKMDNLSDVSDSDVIPGEVSSRFFEISGQPAEEIIFDQSEDIEGVGTLELRSMLLGFELNNSVYAWLYTAEKHSFDRNREVVREMANRLDAGQTVIPDVGEFIGKPAVASSGDHILVVSCRVIDGSPNKYQLIGQIMSQNRVLQGDEISILDSTDTGFSDCDRKDLTLVFDGSDFILGHLWGPIRHRLDFKKISVTGDVEDYAIDNFPQNTDDNILIDAFDMAFDGNQILLVWSQSKTDNTTFPSTVVKSVESAFISPQNSLTQHQTLQKDLADHYPSHINERVIPQVSYTNHHHLVIWSPEFHRLTRRDYPMNIYGQIIEINGAIKLNQPMLIQEDGDNIRPRYVQVTSDDEQFLVAWIEGEIDDSVIEEGTFRVVARKLNTNAEFVSNTEGNPTVEIVPDRQLLQPLTVPKSISKSYLDVTYHNNQFYFAWVHRDNNDSMGVWAVNTNNSLSSVSELSSLGAIREAALGHMVAPSYPIWGHFTDKNMVFWSAFSGIQGWRYHE